MGLSLMPRKILVCFKNDLRLRDNETWNDASQQGAQVIPLYIFDPRQLDFTNLAFHKRDISAPNS